MKKLFSFLLLFAGIAATAQQKNEYNDPNAKTRIISGEFTKISVSSGVELYLTQGNETALAVSVSDSKYEERFKTEVVNGVLKIYYDNKGLTWANDKNRKLKAWLSFKELQKLTGSAGARVITTNDLSAGDFEMYFSSGSAFKGKLQVKSLLADVDSGAEVDAAGTAVKLTVSASSGAIFKAFDLVSEFCTASANSGGAIRIQVQKEITGSANSGGDIKYKGNATLIKGKINSGGSVKQSR